MIHVCTATYTNYLFLLITIYIVLQVWSGNKLCRLSHTTNLEESIYAKHIGSNNFVFVSYLIPAYPSLDSDLERSNPEIFKEKVKEYIWKNIPSF